MFGTPINIHLLPKEYVKNGKIYKTINTDTMNNYDDYKTGLHDSDSPMNRETFKDEFTPHWDNLSEAYESGYENVFHAKRNEIINELWIVHEVLKVTGHGMKGKIEDIIEKMM